MKTAWAHVHQLWHILCMGFIRKGAFDDLTNIHISYLPNLNFLCHFYQIMSTSCINRCTAVSWLLTFCFRKYVTYDPTCTKSEDCSRFHSDAVALSDSALSNLLTLTFDLSTVQVLCMWCSVSHWQQYGTTKYHGTTHAKINNVSGHKIWIFYNFMFWIMDANGTQMERNILTSWPLTYQNCAICYSGI